MTLSTNSGDLPRDAQEARSAQNRANAQAAVIPQAPASGGINFDSDEPLEGGVCDMSPGCESCQ